MMTIIMIVMMLMIMIMMPNEKSDRYGNITVCEIQSWYDDNDDDYDDDADADDWDMTMMTMIERLMWQHYSL